MALDEETLSTLVRAELPALYNLSFRLCGNAADAETLCQTAFSLASSDKNNLTKIALAEWKKRLSKKNQRADDKSTDTATKVLNGLDPNEKIVLLLHDIEKKPLGEIASLIDSSTDSVKSRLAKAREAFRQAMNLRAAARRP